MAAKAAEKAPEKKLTAPSKAKKVEKEEELSEEDLKLKSDLEMLLTRLEEKDASLYKPSLESLREQIRSSTNSVTSVPKPLKFLRPHFGRMKAIHLGLAEGEVKKLCASVLSALAMTVKGERDVLKYRLLGQEEDIASWGQEYVKHVSSELGEEWALLAEAEVDGSDKAKDKGVLAKEKERLITLAKLIVLYNLKHNSEVEACDLLMELGQAELLLEMADEESFQRMALYLTSTVAYLAEPDNSTILLTAMRLYLRFGQPVPALVCAAMLNDLAHMKRIFLQCDDPVVQRQMAVILGRQQVFLDIPPETPNHDDLVALNSNNNLSQYFQLLARELDIQEPKVPEDIYKTHLEQSRAGHQPTADSAKANLAASFVNGWVNTGFGTERMMGDEPSKWFYKNKDYGMLSAAASVGLIHRWDIDSGLSKVDSSLYSADPMIKAGTMMAIGIISSGIYHDCDPAQALLADYLVGSPTNTAPEVIRIGAIFGLGLAYTNSSRDSVMSEVVPKLKGILTEPAGQAGTSVEVQCTAALALGLIRVGSACQPTSDAILAFLNSRPPASLNSEHNFRLAGLGLGLVWLGRQKDAKDVVDKVKSLAEPFGPTIATLTDVCAYAATGNVLKIQELLHICSEHHEKEADKDAKEKDAKDPKDKKDKKAEKKEEGLFGQQSVAALGVGLIAMGEEIGSQMSSRIMGMLMRYGETGIRRAVPLSLALTSVSNPQLSVLETLSKFSHDQDGETALSAILGLGLVGAGTNNARLGNMLRGLAVFHGRDGKNLMMVRLAQGLTHLGKGTCTLSPFHMERSLLCPASLAGLLVVSVAMLDSSRTIMGPRQHYLLHSLVPAIQPRHLITFMPSATPETTQLEPVNVPVRVGQALDVVGQAGKPKTITGFQTQTSPVLLAHGERAELATNEYVPVSPFLEGILLLKKNPDYKPPVDSSKTTSKAKTPAKAPAKAAPKPAPKAAADPKVAGPKVM